MPSTPRLNIPYPALSDIADAPAALQALATAADAASFVLQGLLSARPAASTQGRWYFATDNSTVYYDSGSAWVAVNPAALVDAPAGTPSLRTLGTSGTQAAAGNDARLSDQRVPTDGSVTSAKVASTLKPSQGAGGSTEALRALGTAAGTAAAGTHASQHQAGGADEIVAPKLRLLNAAGYSHVGADAKALNWATEVEDTHGMWAVGDPDRINFPFAGMWLLDFYGTWSWSTTGNTPVQMYQSAGSNIWQPPANYSRYLTEGVYSAAVGPVQTWHTSALVRCTTAPGWIEFATFAPVAVSAGFTNLTLTACYLGA